MIIVNKKIRKNTL